MLNYAYVIAQAQIKIQIIAEGRDPTIGLMHHDSWKQRDNLVLDLFEPLRPIVDRVVFEFVREDVFSTQVFTITPQGVCRLNPQLARLIVKKVSDLVSLTESE